jgi:hypothetical protein
VQKLNENSMILLEKFYLAILAMAAMYNKGASHQSLLFGAYPNNTNINWWAMGTYAH